MASTKKALSGTKPTAKTSKAGTTRTRTQTEKGKYNARSRQKHAPKRIAETSEPEDSSEEETRRPRKKRSKCTEETDSEETGCGVEDVVEVTSGNESESIVRVSVRHLLLFWQNTI